MKLPSNRNLYTAFIEWFLRSFPVNIENNKQGNLKLKCIQTFYSSYTLHR